MKTRRLICTLIFIFALVIPTSAFASSGQYQSNSNHGLFQDICDFFSFGSNHKGKDYNDYGGKGHDNDHDGKDYGDHDDNDYGHHGDKDDDDDCWDWLWDWWCGGGGGHHGDDDGGHHGGGDDGDNQCKHGNFSNDDGCTTSKDVWKWWFCH